MELLLLLLLAQTPQQLGQPDYSAQSIANAAANVPGWYAPNTFVSIYGWNLAYITRAITAGDIRGGELPDVLFESGVRVHLGATAASIFYVSPTQVNVLVPAHLTEGTFRLQLLRDGFAGPPVEIRLDPTAPALFEQEGRVIASHLDGSLVTESAPAARGEIVVLWATGLGPVVRRTDPNHIPSAASLLTDFDRFHVLVNGEPVPRDHLFYAGVAPGFAGLYQINVRMPAGAADDPEIRVGTLDRFSPAERRLTLR